MTLKNIAISPGVVLTDTETAARPYWRLANRIRFVNKLAQKLNGWEKRLDDQLDGVCRGMGAWLDNDGVARAMFGTEEKLEVLDNETIADVTPIAESGTLVNPFSTTSGSAIVNVNDSSHTRFQGDHVHFSGASAVGGITINGEYTVTSVVDNN